jgi:hypothetical protein
MHGDNELALAHIHNVRSKKRSKQAFAVRDLFKNYFGYISSPQEVVSWQYELVH